jgi:RNA polymerase sigma-70 factor (ECF subfamily)
VRAARVPIAGRERVVKLIVAVSSHFWNGVKLSWIQTNGQWSALLSCNETILTVVTIEASADGIEQILWMMRPSKLAAISKAQQTTMGPAWRS